MNNTNSDRSKKFNSFPRKTKEDYQKEQNAIVEQQKRSLSMIDETCSYLNNYLISTSKNNYNKVNMREILSFLNEEKGHPFDATKAIAQYNYLLMDLANARKNKSITGTRINIRIAYIKERLESFLKKELHPKIDDMMKKYEALFKLENL